MVDLSVLSKYMRKMVFHETSLKWCVARGGCVDTDTELGDAGINAGGEEKHM